MKTNPYVEITDARIGDVEVSDFTFFAATNGRGKGIVRAALGGETHNQRKRRHRRQK